MRVLLAALAAWGILMTGGLYLYYGHWVQPLVAAGCFTLLIGGWWLILRARDWS